MTLSPTLERAVLNLNLQDVVVKSISTTLNDDVVPGVNFSPATSTAFQARDPQCVDLRVFDANDGQSRVVVFEIVAGIRVLGKTAEELAGFSAEEIAGEVVGTIEAALFVSYVEQKQDNEFVPDECLIRFSQANVPFNAWPYWRELVQSACSRMSLPRIVLPSHRLKKKDFAQLDTSPIAVRR